MRIQAEIEQAKRARVAIHPEACPRSVEESCAACPSVIGVLLVARHLRANSNDAKGARLILHDLVCQSGCATEPGMLAAAHEHARTQSKCVAALRKWLIANPKEAGQ